MSTEKYLNSPKRKRMMRRWRLDYYRREREKNYNQGLRCDGRPRLTDRGPVSGVQERLARLRKSQKARRVRFIAKRHAAGLTSRGTLLKKKPEPTPLEIIFREVQPKSRVLTFSDIQNGRDEIAYKL